MGIKEFLTQITLATYLVASLPPAIAQDWTARTHSHEKTTNFKIPLLDSGTLKQEYALLKSSIENDNNTLFHGDITLEIPTEYTRLCNTEYGKFGPICRPLKLQHKFLKLNERNFNVVFSINKDVNAKFKPITDMEKYGKSDFWPAGTFLSSGDCDKSVRLKHWLLLQQSDLPPDSLNLALVNYIHADGTVEGHLVLLVSMIDEGGKITTFVLDNTREKIMTLKSATHLQFFSILKSDNSHWVLVKRPL